VLSSPENVTPLRSEIKNPAAIGRSFNLWVNKHCSHQMDALDVDLLVYKKSKRILRLFEAKYPNEQLRQSQRRVLPILERGIALLVQSGLLAAGSGVWIVRGEPPYERGASIEPASRLERRQLSQEELIDFVDCAT
jgi:hypothetical protein